MKKTLINILKIGIPLSLGVFLIWWIYKGLGEDEKQNIFSSLKTADYKWFFAAFILGVFSHLSRAYRWQIMAESMGYKTKLINSMGAVMIGYLANLAFPRLGEVSRCAVLNKYEKIPIEKALGTIIAERAIDLIILLTISFTVLLVEYDIIYHFLSQTILIPIAEKFSGEDGLKIKLVLFFAILIFIVIGYFLLRNKFSGIINKLKGLMVGVLEGLQSVLKLKRKFVFIFHSFFIWGCYILMLYLCFFSLPETSVLPFGAAMSAFVFGSFGIIAVQGGIGAYQALVTKTLALYGLAEAYGFALGWISWTAQTLMILVLGFLAIFMLPILNKDYKNDKI